MKMRTVKVRLLRLRVTVEKEMGMIDVDLKVLFGLGILCLLVVGCLTVSNGIMFMFLLLAVILIVSYVGYNLYTRE
ncbi:MAG: hypothetical protein FWH54_00830 [Methanobrevibacter sp.]|nr:hypothetical protein [Methanobrevibacter sp.]